MTHKVNKLTKVRTNSALGAGPSEVDAAISKLDMLAAAAAGFADARKKAKIQNSETAWLDALDEIVMRETYRCAKAIANVTHPERQRG